MAENSTSNHLILKILSGSQRGVEVSLADGEYTLGSGQDDDLQFVDLSLRAGHARLRLADGKIEIAGGGGAVRVQNSPDIDAGDEQWHPVDALNVVTIGTTSLAIGRMDAEWADLANYSAAPENNEVPPQVKPKSKRPAGAYRESRWAKIAWAGLSTAAVIALVGWLFTLGFNENQGDKTAIDRTDFQIIRAALDQFDFGKKIALRQEVDGVIYANGYVEKPVERRALRNAVDETGISARLRLWVLSSLRSQLDSVVSNQNVEVSYVIASSGEVTLSGDVLDDEKAVRFIETIGNEVSGIKGIISNIKTAKTYLEEVRQLGDRSDISDAVIFQLQGNLIEASGVVLTEKLDGWVGFIQSYARRYADRIPLRTYVQLVNEAGEILAQPDASRPGQPVLVGDVEDNVDVRNADVVNGKPVSKLNLRRLKQGSFNATDVFVGSEAKVVEPEEVIPDAETIDEQTNESDRANGAGLDVSSTNTFDISPIASNPTVSSEQLSQSAATLIDRWLKDKPGQRKLLVEKLVRTIAPNSADNQTTLDQNGFRETERKPESKELLRLLRNGLLNSGSGDNLGSDVVSDNVPATSDHVPEAIDEIFEEVANRWRSSIALVRNNDLGVASADDSDAAFVNDFLPLVVNSPSRGEQCWPNSRLTETNLPSLLFWLDILSVSSEISIDAFDLNNQQILIEAALSPQKIRQCAKRLGARVSVPLERVSLYLAETQRNPDFIRFLVRDLPNFPMTIEGAMHGRDQRYIQVRDGRKIVEGAAPNTTSKISSVGELGVLIQLVDSFATVVYEDLSWRSGG